MKIKKQDSISNDCIEELVKVQFELSKKVILTPIDESKIDIIAGVDVSYFSGQSLGVVVVLNKAFETIKVIHTVEETSFPYIPGFLAFREISVVMKCFDELKREGLIPDVVLFDGQGIAHPRKIGIASHAGVLLNIPTIGVAKSRLYGTCTKPNQPGEATYLMDEKGTVIGYCYLPKEGVNPIFISPGHLCDVESALKVVKMFTKSYRLPEPTRLAHLYSQKFKKMNMEENF